MSTRKSVRSSRSRQFSNASQVNLHSIAESQSDQPPKDINEILKDANFDVFEANQKELIEKYEKDI